MKLISLIGFLICVVASAKSDSVAAPEPKTTRGLLYPRDTETREVRSLDGIWNFIKSDSKNSSQGVLERWFDREFSTDPVLKPIQMPVPSSYNDITEDPSLRDHVGVVWYDRKFFAPKSWGRKQRVWIRFGSVHYEAHVWINGKLVMEHELGHLPFEGEITDLLKFGQANRVTVLCDNVLTPTTVPQGVLQDVETDNGTETVQQYTFDFFNYGGIHRSVHLYTTPVIHISEIVITTDLSVADGIVNYEVKSNAKATADVSVLVKILDKQENLVAESWDSKGTITISNAKFWWPYLMDTEPGHLYTMKVYLSTKLQPNIDVYYQRFGVRTLKWSNSSLLINGKPIYFRGFGRHEDSDIRGKGLDLALLTKDFSLLEWIGANAYRTSHYPYSEESMEFADEHGIMIIDECPSVNAENFTLELQEKHKESIEQLIHRDRNHPSVIMWSIANEPRAHLEGADEYFGAIANYTRQLDPTRPITASMNVRVEQNLAAKHLDIISFNRYNGWYANPGKLNMIRDNVIREATGWYDKHKKLVLMSEYGSDTIPGLHLLPAYVWSEEYQVQQFSKHFEAFDILKQKGFFIGEFVWNFADFKTAQTVTRVGGNKKGVFTRNRQPKASAHHLRKRYFALAAELDDFTEVPSDLDLYVSEGYHNPEFTRNYNEL